MELINKPLTMSSVEIAELTEKRHDHVLRDIEKMLNELEIGLPKFGGTYKNAQNKELKCYNLNKELTETLITGYSIKLRHAVIKRLRQLEEERVKLPTDPKEQALMLAQSVIELNKTIEAQKPAVQFTKQISAARDSISIGDFAKILYSSENLVIGRTRLFKWLRDNKYLIDTHTPYQKYMDQGIFEVVTGVIENSSYPRIWKTVKVTGKGMVYLTDKLIKSEQFKPEKEEK